MKLTDNVIYHKRMPFSFYLLFLFTVFLFGCRKLNQYPKSSLSPETFFRTEKDLEEYTNKFYDDIVPDALDIFYSVTNNADDQAVTNLSDAIRGTRIVPNSGGGWSWRKLREINFFLAHSDQCEDAAAKLHYNGVARFFRAWFYYKKVRRFGDVPWYSKPIGTDDDKELLKSRDSRVLIIDSIIADLNFAIRNLPINHNISRITKWTALALKSRVCLFEGTFRKYHQDDVFGKDIEGRTLGGWKELLQECVSASKAVMDSGGYSIYKSDGPKVSYYNLFTADDAIEKEVILARVFDQDLNVTYEANFRTLSSSFGRSGLTKNFVDSYLMIDGTRFTDIQGYDTLGFYDECQDRDPRLSQTMTAPGYPDGPSLITVPDFASTTTGYQWRKYVVSNNQNEKNTNDLPVFRYAEVLLNYAEAKAELNIITQADLDQSIKLIRDRVEMPSIDLNYANANPDPYLAGLYTHVVGPDKGVILEIRRERRVELVREGFRYWDLMRWKEGHLLSEQYKGMYFHGVGRYDLDRDGNIDLVLYSNNIPDERPGTQVFSIDNELILTEGSKGNIIANPSLMKNEFNEEKDYLFPLPVEELLLNPSLIQNPGW